MGVAWCRIACGLLLFFGIFLTTSIPRWYVEEGASISIKRVQVTADSLRSCVAVAIGGA
jgi:hypothetical protein